MSKMKMPSVDISGGIDEIALEGGEISFEDLQKDGALKASLTQNIEHLTRFLEIQIKKAETGGRVFVIFDKLDESWVVESFESCKKIISGLVHAADYCLSEYKGRIRPIVFLREDIFQSLDINDRNKLREDCSSTLMWDIESLEKMLLERVNFYALRALQPRILDLASLFDRKEMRSRTTPVRYLFNRTFCRPRDLVAYGNKVVGAMKEEGGGERNDRDRLSAEAIYLSEAGYSEYLYQELDDEWRTQRPEFAEYLNAFENIGYSIFTPSQYSGELSRKLEGLDRAKFREALRFLFEVSGIGFRVGQSNIWRFKCFYPTQGFQDAETYKAHPGLIKRLGLKEAQSSNAAGGDNGSEELFPSDALQVEAKNSSTT